MIEEKKTNTEISDLGEFGLIEYLTKNIKLKNKSSIYGVGDDAAVIKTKSHQVVTTDLLVEGIHFDLMYTPLKHLGYKSVIANISDIYAMNATPKQITVSIAISSKFSLENIDELYSGIYLACERYGVDVIGGDTSSSVTGLLISITAIGEVDNKNKITYRNGAKANDLICVSGDLGAAYMGLQLLEREKKVFLETGSQQPDLDGYDYVLERFLKPEARKEIIELLDELKIIPTSMIDISDGLSSELMHICTQSKLGCNIYADKIPIDLTTINIAEKFNIESMVPVLNGGEDYELLFTISISDFEKIKDKKEIKIIGNITEEANGRNIVTNNGTAIELQAQGWQQISKKEDNEN